MRIDQLQSDKAYHKVRIEVHIEDNSYRLDTNPSTLGELLSAASHGVQPMLVCLSSDIYQLTPAGVERARAEVSNEFMRWWRKRQIGERIRFVVGMTIVILLALLIERLVF